MLLSSSYTPQPQRLSPQYTLPQNNMLNFPSSQDGMWNDIDLQLSSMPAPSSKASLSRRASVQRPTTSTLQRGNSMRIVKPSQSGSTHNSPLGLGLSSKAALGRRMTVMGDTSGYRRQRLLEATAAIGQQQQAQIQQNQMRQRAGTALQQPRPVSWCPTMSSDTSLGMESWNGNATQQQGEAILRRQAAQYSPESQLRLQQLQQWQEMQQLQSQQAAQQQQAMRIQQAQQIQQQRQQMQMQQLQQQQAQQEANYFALDTNTYSNNATPYFSQQSTPLQFPTYSLPFTNGTYYDTSSYSSTPLDMPTYPTQQDFSSFNMLNVPINACMGAMSTTPPTPETFPMQDQFQPQYINDSTTSFLLDTDNQEDDSEVLVGLGLYSAPDSGKEKSQTIAEPHIVELYRRAGVELESNEDKGGKGLKLEDSWTPPAESEKDEDEEDNDAEGEEEEEEEAVVVEENVSPVEQQNPTQQGTMAPPLGWL